MARLRSSAASVGRHSAQAELAVKDILAAKACEKVKTATSAMDHRSQAPKRKATTGQPSESTELPMELATCSSNKKPKLDILISNVVCCFKLGCSIDLWDVARRSWNVERKSSWNFLRLRLRKPNILVTMWGSGSVSTMGANSEADAYLGVRRVARIIQNLGYPVRLRGHRIVNVAATCLLPWAIDLDQFAKNNQPCGNYEPELLNCLVYHLLEPKSCFFIFANGSLNVTSNSIENVHRAVDSLYERALKYSQARSQAQIEKLCKKK